MKNEIDEIKKIYYDSKNLSSFFSLLNTKRNIKLKVVFDDIKAKTCYFYTLKGSSIQTLYNILHNINTYQTYNDGRTENF